MTVKTVFLSSTARDLPEHREQVFRAISALEGYACIRMEDFNADDPPPAEVCRRKVAGCDLFVGVIGWLHGSTPPDSDRSFTEIEYDQAETAGIPRLIFLAPDEFPVPANLREPDHKQSAQVAFRERLKAERTGKFFTSPEDLALKVVTAIKDREGRAEQFDRGLSALTDLMREPEVYEAVIRFRAEFESACQQVRAVADQKELHDLLHRLEFQCYNQLFRMYRRLRKPGGDKDFEDELAILAIHADEFRSIVEKLQEVSSRVDESGRHSWIEELEEAGSYLEAAAGTSDSEQTVEHLADAIPLMRAVLDVEPSKINSQLQQAAHSLRLDELLEGLTVIKDKLSDTGFDAQKIEQFENGISALADLSQQVRERTVRHDKWQDLESNLRRIDGALPRLDHKDLTASWRQVRKLLTELDHDGELEAYATEIQQEIEAGNDRKARQLFPRCRTRAGRRFFEVDADLKRICDELRETGRPLTSVLELL